MHSIEFNLCHLPTDDNLGTQERHRKVRSKVLDAYLKTADKMTIKYKKKKKTRMETLPVKTSVTVRVPRKLRASVDVQRVPGVIAHVSNHKQPQYRVLTSYGLIKDVLTASDVNEYVGTMTRTLDISTWESSPQISLHKASEKYNHRDQCKAAIKNSVCITIPTYVYGSMNTRIT